MEIHSNYITNNDCEVGFVYSYDYGTREQPPYSELEIKYIKYLDIDVLDLLEDVAHEWLEDLSETLEEYVKDKV
jgi:hypothetical protein